MLGEWRVLGDGAVDLRGEGCPLVRRGQPLGRQRRIDPADEVIEVELVGVVVADFGHAESGLGHRVAIALLAGVVGAAGTGGGAAQPLFEESAQRPRPGAVLQPHRCAVGDHRDPAARAQQRNERGDQLAVVHPVQGLPDSHRPGTAAAEQRCQRREVSVRAEQPGRVPDALFGGGLPGAGQHVRFGVHPGDGAHLAGDRQGELPGPAAKVDDDVVAGQPEGIEERADHGRRVAAPVLVIETGDLAAETKVFAHPSRVDRRRSAAVAVQRTAYRARVTLRRAPPGRRVPGQDAGRGQSDGIPNEGNRSIAVASSVLALSITACQSG